MRAIPTPLQEPPTRCASAAARSGPLPADIAEPAVCEDLCKRVLAEAGPIDILVNNVGGRNLDVAIEDTDLETWQRFVDLNLTHCFICTKMIGGAMLERGEGRVINIASISGMVANRGIGGRHYETAKAARDPFHPRHRRRLGAARRHRQRHLPGPVHDRAQSSPGRRSIPR